MEVCSFSEKSVIFLALFLPLFFVHAPIYAWLFVRWRQRYYLGFVPAMFSALSVLPTLYADHSCGPLIDFGKDTVFLFGGSCVFLSMAWLWYFAPAIERGPFGYLYCFIMFSLALPLWGAAFSFLWLVASLRKEMLFFVYSHDVPFSERCFGAGGIIVAWIILLLIAAYHG